MNFLFPGVKSGKLATTAIVFAALSFFHAKKAYVFYKTSDLDGIIQM